MITGHTKVFALLGHPVARSLSPQLHNRWFADLQIDGVYVALDAPPDADVGAALRTLGLAGVNLTVPFKESVIRSLDALDADATRAGAVNVVVREGGRLVGHNTDGAGFVAAVGADGVALDGRRVTIIGAGGSARAIAAAAARSGARVTVANRGLDRARRVADVVGGAAIGLEALPDVLAGTDVLIQTAGGDGASLSLPLDALPDDAAVCDINYWLAGPPLVEAARARGLRAVTGLGMLVHQAALAFAWFTGQLPDAEATLAELSGRSPPLAPP